MAGSLGGSRHKTFLKNQWGYGLTGEHVGGVCLMPASSLTSGTPAMLPRVLPATLPACTLGSDVGGGGGRLKVGDQDRSGPEKGVITKGVFSLEESLECLKCLNSLESPDNGRILLYFPQSVGSLKFLVN